MKSTIIFIGTFFLAISFWACTKNNQSEPSIPEDRSFFKIDSVDAVKYSKDYIAYINSVEATLSEGNESPTQDNGKFLIFGVKVNIRELLVILKDADSFDNEENELYVMLGIIPSKIEPSIDSVELMFSLKSMENDSWSFYDFTVPCPNACPDWLVEN